ncbi:DUF2232 domain-containing protein [Haloimpatiens sp. FM7315]|uniref:DUF2232 domain-containing protein n=1 Tax=Haloimpatiens sp. FM7315 TaxID=3298609 RepID=UPI003709D720
MRNDKVRTKSLIEAAVLSAIIVVVMVLSMYVPFFEIIGIAISPIIICILYIKHGFKFTTLSIVVSFTLLVILTNVVYAATFLIINAIPGICLGYCIKTKKSAVATVIIVAVIYVIVIAASTYIVSYITYNDGIFGVVNKFVLEYKEVLNETMEQYQKMGVSADKIEIIKQSNSQLTSELILNMLPSCLSIISIILSFSVYKILYSVLKKLKIQINPMKDFNKWHLDDKITALIIGFIAISIIMNSKKLYGAETLLYTAFNLGKLIFVVFGIALISDVLSGRYKLSKTIVFIIVLVSLVFKADIIYLIIGIIDSVINFRKIKENFQGNK